jgi:hypothetical protein
LETGQKLQTEKNDSTLINNKLRKPSQIINALLIVTFRIVKSEMNRQECKREKNVINEMEIEKLLFKVRKAVNNTKKY